MEDFKTPEDLFREGSQKIEQAGQNIMKFMPFIAGIILLLFALQGLVYSIGPDEVGIVQRFGKYAREAGPGLHMKLPFGIEKVTPVKVKKIFKEEFGFRTIQAGVKTRYASRQYPEESLMLTGDLNILDVRWIVQFKVSDPMKLLFMTRNPLDNVRDLSEVVMSRLCGDYRVDELLTTKREEIDHEAERALQALLDKYETGIHVVTVKLLDVNPTDIVKPAFNEVNEAKQERERLINEAREEYNKVIPGAKGEALRTISQAEGYALDKVNRAKGEAARFVATWNAYQKSPEITKKRLYLETMKEVIPKSDKRIIIDSGQKSILPIFDINKEGVI